MSDDPGYMFPSLDGNVPGDQPKSEEITGIPLPPMSDTSAFQRSNAPTNSQIQPVGNQEGIPEVPAGEVPYGEEPAPDEGRRNKRTARERISQLTQRYRQEQDKTGQLEQEVASLRQQLNRQQDEFSQMSRQPPVQPRPPAEEPTYADYANPPMADVPRGVNRGELRQIVEEVVAPIHQRIEAGERQSRLQQQQQESLYQAFDVIPELKDINTPEAAAFRELMESNPVFRNDPNGPLNVAYMVRGVFAEEQQAEPIVEARKRAASVVAPGPRQLPTQPTRRRAMEKVVTEGLKRFSEGDESPETYMAIRKAQRRL